MSGLRIKTIPAGEEFEVYGTVTFKDFPEQLCGGQIIPAERVYYCAGWSYPAAIVQEIIPNVA